MLEQSIPAPTGSSPHSAGRAAMGRGARVTGTTAIVLAVHFLRYAGPLIYVPMVVRWLPVSEAGLFFRYQSLGLMLALVVEFGLSGTALRDWGRQATPGDRSRLFNLLMAERAGNAACVAALGLVLAAAGALTWTDLLVILPFAVASGMNMTWYFMASGRPLVGSSLEAVSQAAGIALLLATMSATGSGAWATLALVAGQALNVAYGLAAARRDGVAYAPRVAVGMGYKLQQAPMFVVRVGAMVSSAGSPWVVSSLAGIAQAGLYGPAARLFGAVAATMSPIGDVLIPLIAKRSTTVRRHQAVFVSAGALLGGAILGAAIHLLSGPVTLFLYGGLQGEAGDLVRVLAYSVPFIFASQALSLFVLVPGGREKIAARAILLGAAVFVGLALLDRSAAGAATAKVGADVATFMAMFILTMTGGRGEPDA